MTHPSSTCLNVRSEARHSHRIPHIRLSRGTRDDLRAVTAAVRVHWTELRSAVTPGAGDRAKPLVTIVYMSISEMAQICLPRVYKWLDGLSRSLLNWHGSMHGLRKLVYKAKVHVYCWNDLIPYMNASCMCLRWVESRLLEIECSVLCTLNPTVVVRIS